MKDLVSVQRVLTLHPSIRDQTTSFINQVEAFTGRTWRIVQAFRSFAQQQAEYNQGRTTPGKIVTWAPAGMSWHCYGLAFDSIPFMDGSLTTLDWDFDLKSVESIAIACGLECGMDWPEPKTDSDHFENRFGLEILDAYHLYTIKDFIPGTEFINLPA